MEKEGIKKNYKEWLEGTDEEVEKDKLIINEGKKED